MQGIGDLALNSYARIDQIIVQSYIEPILEDADFDDDNDADGGDFLILQLRFPETSRKGISS